MAFIKSIKNPNINEEDKVAKVSGDLNVEGIIYASKVLDPEYVVIYINNSSNIKSRLIKFISEDGAIHSSLISEDLISNEMVNTFEKNLGNIFVQSYKINKNSDSTKVTAKLGNKSFNISNATDIYIDRGISDLTAIEDDLIPCYKTSFSNISIGQLYIELKEKEESESSYNRTYYTPIKPSGRLEAGDIMIYRSNLVKKEA